MRDENDLHNGLTSGVFFDRIDGLWWGLATIWAALVIVAENVSWSESWTWWHPWGVLFTGAGALALLCAVIRFQNAAYRAKWVFSAVFGVIFLAIGLSAWQVGWWIWAIALLSVGAVILISVFSRQE